MLFQTIVAATIFIIDSKAILILKQTDIILNALSFSRNTALFKFI